MPSTSLAEQLKKLETPQTNLLVSKKAKTSLLFDPKDAANYDRDTFFEIGQSGLEELIKLNQNFTKFESTLFDVSSKHFERAIQTEESGLKLDKELRSFLILLSPYFLLKPAHKALEWLINRYHIQDFNVNDIIFMALPYHDTMIFARLLQVIRLSKDTGQWHWLYNSQKEGVPLSKSALLNRASVDMSFFKFVCEMPSKAIEVHGGETKCLGTLFAFYCTTILGALESAKVITELHVSHMLPSVLAGLSSKLSDFTASAYMILARLCTKMSLTERLMTGLYNKISRVDQPRLRHETALILALISQSDHSRFPLPTKAIKHLASSDWFIPTLATLSANGIIVIHLISAILTTTLKSIVEGKEALKNFAEKLVQGVSLVDEDAEVLFRTLLENFKEDAPEDVVNWYGKLVRGLERAFPKVFDQVTSTELRRKSRTSAIVSTLLGANTSRVEIFQQLIHPEGEIRAEAVSRIGSLEPADIAWLRETLEDRLSDNHPCVIRAISQLPASHLQFILGGPFVAHAAQLVARSFLQQNIDVNVVSSALDCLLNNSTEEDNTLVLLVVIPIFLWPKKNELLRNQISSSRIGKGLEDTDILTCLASKCSDMESIQKAMESLNVDHPVYQFSSLALTASLLLKEFSFSAYESLMEILVKYLSSANLSGASSSKYDKFSKEMMTYCLAEAQSGRLPVELALCCLHHGTKHLFEGFLVLISDSCSLHEEWIDFDSRTHRLILNQFKILVKGTGSKKKDVSAAFNRALESFINTPSFCEYALIIFLLNAGVYDSTLASYCLKRVKEILVASPDRSLNLLNSKSTAIPCLMIICTSPEAKIREKALAILKILSISLSTPFYRLFAEELYHFAEEMIIDEAQIHIACYTRLSAEPDVRSLISSQKHADLDNARNTLFEIILSEATPLFVKRSLLQILQCVNSEEIFLQLVPVASDLLKTNRALTSHESVILQSIIRRLNEKTITCLSKPEVWGFIEDVLSDQTTTIVDLETEEKTCPAVLLINQITPMCFNAIPSPTPTNQERLLNTVIVNAAESENIQYTRATASLFKRIVLDAKIVVSLLSQMQTVNSQPTGVKMRKRLSAIPSLEILETPEWKRGVCLLELVQSKKKLTSIHLLLSVLFDILRKCLRFDHQAPVEYTKQIVLSNILHCCQSLSVEDQLVPGCLQVDLIVQCVRASQNPQTHHHALMALTHMAHVVPDQVIHNIMAIFTFIGSSVLRQEDAYSFQIICKIIDVIIPVVIKSDEGKTLDVQVANILRVFVAAMLDIPEHRRIPIFTKLMTVLNEGEFLWIFLCQVFENHVSKPSAVSTGMETKEELDRGSMPKKLEVASLVALEFPASILLETCRNLLIHSIDLPIEKALFEGLPDLTKAKLGMVFDIVNNTAKQLRHYKYTLLLFLSSLLSSNRFVEQIIAISDDEASELQESFNSLVEYCLIYLKILTKQAETSENTPAAKYWRAILSQCYDILDKINGLLPTKLFLEVIRNLLRQTEEPILRRKAVELLGWKLQQTTSIPSEDLLTLLKPLVKIVKTITPNSESVTHEDLILQQTVLFALKLMIRHLGSSHVDKFKKILKTVTEILEWEKPPAWTVLGSLILCLGELVAVLKVHSLQFLSRFMPALISIMKHHISEESGDLFLLSTVACLLKIVECLSQFLSPYMDKLLFRVSYLSAKCEACSETGEKLLPTAQKLKLIRQKIPNDVPMRVLVPAVTTCYDKLIEKQEYSSIPFLLTTLSDGFTQSQTLTPEVTSFFLGALNFRSLDPEPNPESIAVVELSVIRAFTVLVMKLSESSFRPLYYKLYDWGVGKQGPSERSITFYNLSQHIAESLKGLFVLFAGHLIQNAATLLDKTNISKEPDGWFSQGDTEAKSCQLLDAILRTLLSVFTYDHQSFVTKERFSCLMQPLVDQLENRLGGDEVAKTRRETLVVPTVAQMTSSISDDTLWKQLNYEVLLKTRHSESEVRLAALNTVCLIAQKLGDDFLPLLPETVPFLAELLEDDDEQVEKACQATVHEMETVLGEPIQKYF